MKENIDIAPIILFMGVLNKERHPRSPPPPKKSWTLDSGITKMGFCSCYSFFSKHSLRLQIRLPAAAVSISFSSQPFIGCGVTASLCRSNCLTVYGGALLLSINNHLQFTRINGICRSCQSKVVDCRGQRIWTKKLFPDLRRSTIWGGG